jgi:hypothetical protein
VLSDRLSRALRGEGPSSALATPGQPPEVEALFAQIDLALAREDMPTVCNRLGAAQGAVNDWLQRLPAGPRQARLAEVAGTDLEELRFGCSLSAHADVAARWKRIKSKLEPGP